MRSQVLPVVVGLATGIGLILAFIFFPVLDNSPQAQYERNFARVSADADCTEEQCTIDNIAYCEINTKSVIPVQGTYVWIVSVTEYDMKSCTYIFENRDLGGSDSKFVASITYKCRAFAEDLRRIGEQNSSDTYIQKILSFYGTRCGISMP